MSCTLSNVCNNTEGSHKVDISNVMKIPCLTNSQPRYQMLSSSRLMSGCTTTPTVLIFTKTISSASRVSNTQLYHECFNSRGRGVRTVISVRYVTGRLDLHQSSCYSSITSQRLIIIIPSEERSTDRLAFIASN